MGEIKINFFRGHPSSRLLPQDSIIKATSELLGAGSREYDDNEEDRHPLSYGTNKGSLWVRCAIAESINKQFSLGLPTEAAFINLTNGSSYGIMNILQQTTLAHTGYTRQAFLVTPTYFLINETFIDAGFGGKMTAIEETADGEVDIAFLSSKLVEFDSRHEYDNDDSGDLSLINAPGKADLKKVYRYVLYIVPTYSNPTGSSYSTECRNQLIKLARKHDMLIISDDVYDQLVYDQPLDTIPSLIPRLTHLDRETCCSKTQTYGNTISNVSFSKTIAPGLRCGYQESVNALLVDQLSRSGANVSGGTPSQLNSMIIGTLIKSGEAERVLKRLRTVYSERCDALYDAIKKYLPKDTLYKKQRGGYFSWCTLSSRYNNKAVCAELERENGVILANGSRFEVTGDERNWGATSVRLSISFLEVSDIVRGVEIWGRVCRKQRSIPASPLQ